MPPRTNKPEPAAATGPRLVSQTPKKSAQPLTHHEIARRAYEIFEQEGSGHGNHIEHWLRAERELTEVTAGASPKRVAATRARR